MIQKFNIGDKVYNKYVPNSSGFITNIYVREDNPPANWRPTEDNFIPPKMPLICLYKTDSISVYQFEYSLEYDKDYYKMINREDKLNEIGIQDGN